MTTQPSYFYRAGALVRCLKLPAWKIGDRGFKPSSDIQVSKKQDLSSLLSRKDSILWGASVSELGLRPPGFEF